MEVGLVDHLGGLQTATERAAQLAGLEEYGILPLTPAVDPRQRLLAELVQNVDIGLPRTWGNSRPASQLARYLQIAQMLGEPGENYAFCLVCPTNSDWSY
jgi:ClpP class serine protease